MNRPYTICYLNVSAEAHIDGDFGRLPEAAPASDVFRQRWLDKKADAIVYGATTMAMFADGKIADLPKAQRTYPREDYIAPCQEKRYYIAIDPMGSIAYRGSTIASIRGRGIHGVIHALCETVSDDYLAYLQSKGISYLFCGKEAFDPVILMEKAYALFGIQKAILSGGAYADWTMLANGLIDEIQTMYLPVIDGDPHSHTLFRRMDHMASAPVALKLEQVEVVAGDGLLVTYRPKNVRANDEGGDGYENRNCANSAE